MDLQRLRPALALLNPKSSATGGVWSCTSARDSGGSAAARPGTVTTALHETLTAIHQGHMPDAHGRVRHW